MVTDEQSTFFRLEEISRWQLGSDDREVRWKIELPALQRGFVWKASQIEELWDSLLRGFPIGSFILSRTTDENLLLLLDGQQRATSIALGYYNPWDLDHSGFWSKHIPVIWIDLAPKITTSSQNFVLRTVTQSHPWGYQRRDHNSPLSVSDRSDALKIFKGVPAQELSYIKFNLSKVFPYDADLPVPLSFLIAAISNNSGNKWKQYLIEQCQQKLPVDHIKTKYFSSDSRNYIDHLIETLNEGDFDNIVNAINNLGAIKIPGIVCKKEILQAEEEQTGQDPTLFVRLNASGTKIVGEELIYSIYKATFPDAKKLVEDIAVNFAAPSLVISLVSRLALIEINGGSYQPPLNVNEFRKRIGDSEFRNKLEALVGPKEQESPAKIIFDRAFKILRSEKNNGLSMPLVLVKNIIRSSPDLFLMLLQWLRLSDGQTSIRVEKRILAAMTALSWFAADNRKYVQQIWSKISGRESFWNKDVLQFPLIQEKGSTMFPLIEPVPLREYLVKNVVDLKRTWDQLINPDSESKILKSYEIILPAESESQNENINTAIGMWKRFIYKLFYLRPLVLFAQREYINKKFEEFNQMDTLEDTNTPWDWDHIYPSNWVYYQQGINPLMREWNNCIGNFRALSLEENRSQGDGWSPKERLNDKVARENGFISEEGYLEYWEKISERIYEDNQEMIQIHLNAVIHRMCDIYENWYVTLGVNELFGVDVVHQ